jgi:hypothetical protein
MSWLSYSIYAVSKETHQIKFFLKKKLKQMNEYDVAKLLGCSKQAHMSVGFLFDIKLAVGTCTCNIC